MNPYDFGDFLERMKALSYPDIIVTADRECGWAERNGSGRGGPRQRELGCRQYADKIKAFLWFMRTGTRPGSASDGEFNSYRGVVQALVERDQFKPEVMKVFER